MGKWDMFKILLPKKYEIPRLKYMSIIVILFEFWLLLSHRNKICWTVFYLVDQDHIEV